jgi:chitinase
MDAEGFDRLVRVMINSTSRRGTVGGIVVGLLAAVVLSADPEAGRRYRKKTQPNGHRQRVYDQGKRGKRKGKGKGHGKTDTQPPSLPPEPLLQEQPPRELQPPPAMSSTRDGGPSRGRRVIGYYAAWTRRSKNYRPLDIPVDKLTHINYASAHIDADGRATLQDPEVDIGYADVSASPDLGSLKGNFHQLRLLKERHPHLQTLISIGGWMGSERFSDVAATEQTRRDFASACIALFLTRWPGVFDGIDIDWEFPVCCGLPENAYRPEDKENSTLLFLELRRQLDALGAATGRPYLLSAALPAGGKLPTRCFELREAGRILDWINVMTYDLDGSERSGFTTFHAPLRAAPDEPGPRSVAAADTVEGTVRVFEAAGVPRDKIVVGVPFYGRGFTGVPNVNDGLYQPFSGTLSIDYHTIKTDYLSKFQRFRHPEAAVPWLYDAESGTMLTYDDPESIARKTDFVREQGLGGVMVWELSGDDKKSRLLTAIASRLSP